MSIIGPNTRKASRELLVKAEAKDKAKNESTVEQTETITFLALPVKLERKIHLS